MRPSLDLLKRSSYLLYMTSSLPPLLNRDLDRSGNPNLSTIISAGVTSSQYFGTAIPCPAIIIKVFNLSLAISMAVGDDINTLHPSHSISFLMADITGSSSVTVGIRRDGRSFFIMSIRIAVKLRSSAGGTTKKESTGRFISFTSVPIIGNDLALKYVTAERPADPA